MTTGPHFSPANANSSRQNSKLQGSSNSSTGESSSQQTSLHSPFATNTLAATALVLSQTEQPKTSTNSPIAPTNVAQTTTSSPKSVATANTATTNTTQSSAVFTSSFFSASTSHLDDDLCSQVASATSSSTRLPFLRPQQQDLQSSQTFNALDLDSSHSRNLHLHRQNNNSSKLPTFRFADLVSPPALLQPFPTSSPQSVEGPPLPPSTSATRTLPVAKSHRRGKSENIPPKPSLLFKSATAPVGSLSVELKAAPTVVTTVSASASGLNRVLSPTSTGNSAPQRLQSVLKKPRENQSPKTTRSPPQARSPNQQKQQETELHENKTSPTKHQTQSQPSSKKTRARLSTSVVEGSKEPIPILSTASKRPASFPTSPRVTQVTFLEPPAAETPPVAAKGAPNRRSFVSSGTTSSGSRAPPISLRAHRVQAAVEAAGVISPTAGSFPNIAASPKAEVIPPSSKTDRATLREHAIGHNKSSSDEKRSSVSRPPITIKPTPASPSTSNSAGSTPVVRVPPIRAFRASGTRRSLTLDTTTSLVLPEDNDDSLENANDTKKHTRQAALRALEGHNSDSIPQIMTPPGSGYDFNGDNDDTGDLFLKIAREDTGRNSISSPHEDAGFFSDDQRPRNTAHFSLSSLHAFPIHS
ncbi:hypothetical protein HOO65_020264 [Ceratocystis lukuohia]|uniref:Uncharacterized protein n=1 Tax=Ceratocystis lukuohia TaxID=2019550 RepID=A0ABR4MN67_9PEZI